MSEPTDTKRIELALLRRLGELCYVLGKRLKPEYVRNMQYIIDDIKAAKN